MWMDKASEYIKETKLKSVIHSIENILIVGCEITKC
jgi:hypothetical protein